MADENLSFLVKGRSALQEPGATKSWTLVLLLELEL